MQGEEREEEAHDSVTLAIFESPVIELEVVNLEMEGDRESQTKERVGDQDQDREGDEQGLTFSH